MEVEEWQKTGKDVNDVRRMRGGHRRGHTGSVQQVLDPLIVLARFEHFTAN